MLRFLPAPVVGVIMLLLLIINTLLWAVPVYTAILLKLLTWGRARDAMSRLTAWLAQNWAGVNVVLVDALLPIDWDIRIETALNPKGQYLVCANHQSWNDIVVLMRTFGRRAPFFKFFIKQELIWVPVLGLAWWGLDYPFMKRHSKEAIEKNPALRGQDLATTRKACEKYRNQPALIVNFLEGTRFTAAKHAQQQSPYRHLLKPKAGGFAFTLAVLGERLNSLLDVTIVYPDGARGFWDFLAGRVRRVIVEVRQLKIPHALYTGDYETDADFRARFQAWISELWQEKDRRIDTLLSASAAART
ncbi:1-acyl-sn-glycerol-3-phosphate acyltransferases [Fontimonas thermophila]|uniref:1-acyl-sn-glycerol-3-phosphate acyltransferases n=1 Tax=Fontimonas thermophila TaxID=1076937 RepID=A0A1I2J663_9GAMM|nr:acyltransferase [Fontimonas thermophila]SFF48446.1 1-acyl-sn-glycerol-3-phosphate acyltransferases [Fontimonas thermophila]